MTGRFLLVVATVLVIVTGSSAWADKPRRPIAVIVGKGAKITSLTPAELKRVFTGDPVTISSIRLVPFNRAPGTPPRVAFDREILGMDPDVVGRFWVDRKIRGQSAAPRTLPSAAYVLKVVARFPGAIGYLPADEVTDAVQVIAIDGVWPSDPDYPVWIK